VAQNGNDVLTASGSAPPRSGAAAPLHACPDQGLLTDTAMKCLVGTELTTSVMPLPGSGICTTPLQLKAPPAELVQALVAR
jgi:hypothetical protein